LKGAASSVKSHDILYNLMPVMDAVRSNGVDWQFQEPKGGMLWLRLTSTDSRLPAQQALRNSVTIAPGNLLVDESHPESLRLPFLSDTQCLSSGVERNIDAWPKLKSEPVSHPAESATA
jgi:hypothetical protein